MWAFAQVNCRTLIESSERTHDEWRSTTRCRHSLLETGLSLHAVVLDEFLGDRELQPSKAPTAKRLLRAIATYRASHPFQHGDAEADRKVEAILATYSSS